jgi:hypothetical protein
MMILRHTRTVPALSKAFSQEIAIKLTLFSRLPRAPRCKISHERRSQSREVIKNLADAGAGAILKQLELLFRMRATAACKVFKMS